MTLCRYVSAAMAGKMLSLTSRERFAPSRFERYFSMPTLRLHRREFSSALTATSNADRRFITRPRRRRAGLGRASLEFHISLTMRVSRGFDFMINEATAFIDVLAASSPRYLLGRHFLIFIFIFRHVPIPLHFTSGKYDFIRCFKSLRAQPSRYRVRYCWFWLITAAWLFDCHR